MHGGIIEYDANTSTNSHQLLGVDPARTRLTIYPPAAGSITLSNQPDVVKGQGIYLAAGMAPLYFDVDFHGDTIQKPIYVINDTATNPFGYIQTLCWGEKGHDAHNPPESQRR